MRDLNLSEKLHPPAPPALAHLRHQEPAGSRRERADEDEGRVAGASGSGARVRAHPGAGGRPRLRRPADPGGRPAPAERGRCARRYRERFQYLLVDEYQDTNRTQYDLVRLLAGGHGNLTVVGDEDQSIYSWRGADIRNILDFEADFPGARVLRLEENYRSTQAILDAASGLVAHNRARKGKTLRATKAGGRAGPVAPGGRRVPGSGLRGRQDRRRPRRRPARRRAVPHERAEPAVRGRRCCAWASPTWSWAASASTSARRSGTCSRTCASIQNPRDHLALRRVLNVPARGIGDRTVAEIERRRPRAGPRGGRRWARSSRTRCCPRAPPSRSRASAR